MTCPPFVIWYLCVFTKMHNCVTYIINLINPNILINLDCTDYINELLFVAWLYAYTSLSVLIIIKITYLQVY